VAAAFVREVAAVFRFRYRFFAPSLRVKTNPRGLSVPRRNIPRMQKDFFAARDDGLSLADDFTE